MIKGILHRARALFRRLGWKKVTALLIGGIAIIGIGSSVLRGSGTEAAPQDAIKIVSVANVGQLSSGGTSLAVAGTVQSQTEATVRAEKSGQVIAVYRSLGDYVAAGTVVAELENASERAAVLQAQGAVQAATAGATTYQSSLSGAKDASVATLLAAYGAAEKAVHTDIDPMFSNPEGTQPSFTVLSSDSQSKIDTESARFALKSKLAREHTRSASLSAQDDLVAEFTITEAEIRAVRDYLDAVIRTLNGGIPSQNVSQTTIEAYKSTATAARSTITTTLSSLTTARLTLQNAIQNSTQGGDANSAAQAALTSAQGTLAAARANLEKTIVRAPISGTINSLTLERGDFVQATTPVLVVANNRALEVIAYITASDVSRIAVGDKATFEGSVAGVITKIAPALDPITKKIEVRVGISSGNTSLVNGQSVVVSFDKPAPTASKPTKGPITLPIAALKIGATDIVVFTVDADSKLEAHPVVLGTLLGDRVEIKSGVTADMNIVVDARGLQAGEKIEVK